MIPTVQEIITHLKQRFPIVMVDRVLEVEVGQRIKTVKNVTDNELQFLGHFGGFAILPNTFLVEAIGQSASILFSLTEQTSLGRHEFLVLAAISGMHFFVPVTPGHTMVVQVSILKALPTMALVEGSVTVDGDVICSGKLSFAKVMNVVMSK